MYTDLSMTRISLVKDTEDLREFVAIRTDSEYIKVPNPFCLDSSFMFAIIRNYGDCIVLDRIVTKENENIEQCLLDDEALKLHEVYIRAATYKEYQDLRQAISTKQAFFEYPLE